MNPQLILLYQSLLTSYSVGFVLEGFGLGENPEERSAAITVVLVSGKGLGEKDIFLLHFLPCASVEYSVASD